MALCCKSFEPYTQAFSDQLLMNYQPQLVFSMFASRDMMPANEGCDLKYARVIPLKAIDRELNMDCCGPDGPPCCVDFEYTIVKPRFYGCYATIEKKCTLQSVLPRVMVYVKEFANQYRLSEDKLIGQIFKQNASVYYARCGDNKDYPTNQSARDYLIAAQKIIANRAKYLFKAQVGTCAVQSNPIPASLGAYLHPDLVPDLYNLVPVFIPKHKYANPEMALLSEEGAVGKVRIFVGDKENMDDTLVSPEASQNGNDVYDIPIFGQDAYVTMWQEKFAPKILFREKEGPFDKCMYVSWQASFGTGIINPKHIINMKVTMGGDAC